MSYHAFGHGLGSEDPLHSCFPLCHRYARSAGGGAPLMNLFAAFGDDTASCAAQGMQYDENTDSCFTQQQYIDYSQGDTDQYGCDSAHRWNGTKCVAKFSFVDSKKQEDSASAAALSIGAAGLLALLFL